MNYREFDNAIYEKCGRLSAQEAAVTGYRTKMDMNRSFVGLYLDPLYQNKLGNGEYQIKGTKDIFPSFRKTKRKNRKRDKEEEEAQAGKRTKAYLGAFKNKTKLSVLKMPMADRTIMMRRDLQVKEQQASKLRAEILSLWVGRSVDAIREGGADAVDSLVETWERMRSNDSLSTANFRMLSTNQMLRTLLTLDDITPKWMEKNVFFQHMDDEFGEARSAGSSLVSDEEIADMYEAAGFDFWTGDSGGDTGGDDGEITGIDLNMSEPAPRRNINQGGEDTMYSPAPRRNINQGSDAAPRRNMNQGSDAAPRRNMNQPSGPVVDQRGHPF